MSSVAARPGIPPPLSPILCCLGTVWIPGGTTKSVALPLVRESMAANFLKEGVEHHINIQIVHRPLLVVV